MRLSPHRLKTADARQGVGASHLTTYFERVYLNNCPMVQADAGEFVCVAIFSRPSVEALEAAERTYLSIFVLQIKMPGIDSCRRFVIQICHTL